MRGGPPSPWDDTADREARITDHESVTAVPHPTLTVIDDLDPLPGTGTRWGEASAILRGTDFAHSRFQHHYRRGQLAVEPPSYSYQQLPPYSFILFAFPFRVRRLRTAANPDTSTTSSPTSPQTTGELVG